MNIDDRVIWNYIWHSCMNKHYHELYARNRKRWVNFFDLIICVSIAMSLISYALSHIQSLQLILSLLSVVGVFLYLIEKIILKMEEKYNQHMKHREVFEGLEKRFERLFREMDGIKEPSDDLLDELIERYGISRFEPHHERYKHMAETRMKQQMDAYLSLYLNVA